MPYKIIIDGYNLINKWQSIRDIFFSNSDAGRNELIKYLANYRKVKKHNIEIIFDAYNSFSLIPSCYAQKGIKIVFTAHRETADDYIKKIISSSNKDLMVVTSDHEIKYHAERNGFIAVNSEKFIEKVEFAYFSNIKEIYKKDEYIERKLNTKKKGNPHKLPKKIRKRMQKLNKL